MTEVYRKRIEHPSAWKSSEIGGKEGLVYRLKPEHLDAIDEALAKTRSLKPQEVRRRQFDHPAVNAFMTEVRDIIMKGRGVAILNGVTHDRYSEEDFERIYWGLGTHLGIGVVQSAWGDRLGHVRHEPNQTNVRAYRSTMELAPHTDQTEIVGLMCVRKAKEGGLSQLASSLAVHNEILATRPDLLEPLYRGYPSYRRGEHQPGEPAITPYDVPIFCSVNGLGSCRYGNAQRVAAEKLGVELPKKFDEALTYFGQVATRPDIQCQFMIEPGEMALWNNFTTLHARAEFKDGEKPEEKRHLLRLWVEVANGRPAVPEMDTCVGKPLSKMGKLSEEVEAA